MEPGLLTPSDSLQLATTEHGVRFAVHVQPRAKRNEICGLYGDALKIRLTAPPVDGAANKALIAFLAKALDVSQRDVFIVSGQTGRHKVIEVQHTTRALVRIRLEKATSKR